DRPLPRIRHLVDQAAIDLYAAASGDFNPIHVDPDYARSGPYGRTIAHGMMTLGFVAQMLREWSDGVFDEHGEIDVVFIAPAMAGETIEVSGTIEGLERRHDAACIKVQLHATAGERQILAGHAYQFLPATGASGDGA